MKWLLLNEDAIEPTRATKFSAGYDVHANETVRIMPHEVAVVKTGVSFEHLNPEHYLQLSLRSGFSIKRPFIMANGYGLIDADYAGNEIGVILWNRSDYPAVIDKGERIAQIVELKYYTVDNEILPTVERDGGYGSTGK
jgi:dUTP pyrophosphatase